MVVSSEHKRKMAEGRKRWGETLTQEQLRAMAARAVATKLSRYGNGRGPKGGNPYSRTKSGKRQDLGGQYFRSSWEANYARFLNWMVAHGDVATWEYEPKTFRFPGVERGTITYTPDFRVELKSGRTEWHEVKGWMDNASKVRLKRMAKHFPSEVLVLVGAPQYREIEKKLGSVIPGWEWPTPAK